MQGEGAIQGLTNKLGGLAKAGDGVSKGFKGLAGSAGGLVGGLQSLMPLATGAGMVALAKGAVDAADNMNDLRQKTGVSVEALSQFKQAAEKSGTTIESVGGAMIKLNRGLADGKAGEALKSLGINANDASGKLKSTDQIMLEVANKFATMPDGAQKTAAAMALFGKSGADMIPMLNMGDKAIKDLAVTMTGEFASGADEFNDKMVDLQTGVAKLGVALGTALMPFLSSVTDGLIAMINGFNQLPGPLQTVIGLAAAIVIAWGPVTGAITAVVGIFTTLGPLLAGLGATIAGWAGIVGPTVAGITAALSGLLAWMTGTMLPALVGIFSGPVGWTVLAIAAVVAMCIAFREPIGQFLTWIGGAFAKGWQVITTTFNQYVLDPIQRAWNALAEMLPRIMKGAAEMVRSVWTGIINAVKGVIRNMLQMVVNSINVVGSQINRLISSFNSLPGPDIPLVPTMSVPAFAEGGVVNRPTLAMVGEAGKEYIIPQSKMGQAAANYLAGARGDAVLSGASGSSAPTINIQTGPVVEFNGTQYVSMSDLQRAMRQTAESVMGRLRTPASRVALGRA